MMRRLGYYVALDLTWGCASGRHTGPVLYDDDPVQNNQSTVKEREKESYKIE